MQTAAPSLAAKAVALSHRLQALRVVKSKKKQCSHPSRSTTQNVHQRIFSNNVFIYLL
jgi:hypothetical protein